jgi:hypothetical protein
MVEVLPVTTISLCMSGALMDCTYSRLVGTVCFIVLLLFTPTYYHQTGVAFFCWKDIFLPV